MSLNYYNLLKNVPSPLLAQQQAMQMQQSPTHGQPDNMLRYYAKRVLNADPSAFSTIINEVLDEYHLKLAIDKIDITTGTYP